MGEHPEDAVVARIADVTEERLLCATCSRPLDAAGPSDLFCGEPCQHRWHERRAGRAAPRCKHCTRSLELARTGSDLFCGEPCRAAWHDARRPERADVYPGVLAERLAELARRQGDVAEYRHVVDPDTGAVSAWVVAREAETNRPIALRSIDGPVAQRCEELGDRCEPSMFRTARTPSGMLRSGERPVGRAVRVCGRCGHDIRIRRDRVDEEVRAWWQRVRPAYNRLLGMMEWAARMDRRIVVLAADVPRVRYALGGDVWRFVEFASPDRVIPPFPPDVRLDLHVVLFEDWVYRADAAVLSDYLTHLLPLVSRNPLREGVTLGYLTADNLPPDRRRDQERMRLLTARQVADAVGVPLALLGFDEAATLPPTSSTRREGRGDGQA